MTMSYMTTLVLGGRRYPLQLSHDELKKYPGSLLAQMADSGESGVVDLDSQPNNPLQDLSDPAAAITSLYRDGLFDEKTVIRLVTSCRGSCKSACSKAENLLKYLGLPGPVTAWLPDVRPLTLRSGTIASFVHRAIAIETVGIILGIKPFKGPKAWAAQNPVLFLIQQPSINDKGQLQVPKVYILESSHQRFLECLESICGICCQGTAPLVDREIYIARDDVRVYPADPCEMLQSAEASADLEDVIGEDCTPDFGKVMGTGDPGLASVIKDELQPACKEVGLAAESLDICWEGPSDDRVPVWSIRW